MQEISSSSFRVVRSTAEAAFSQDEDAQTQVYSIEDNIGYRINYVARQLARFQAACLATHGVTLGQWSVLMFLWAQDGQTQGELSRQVAIDDATMVRSIDRMERDSLVQRVRNPQDRRQINIFLTEKGQALRDVLIPCSLAVNGVAIQGFTQDELRQFEAFLRRMSAELSQVAKLQQQGNDYRETKGDTP